MICIAPTFGKIQGAFVARLLRVHVWNTVSHSRFCVCELLVAFCGNINCTLPWICIQLSTINKYMVLLYSKLNVTDIHLAFVAHYQWL